MKSKPQEVKSYMYGSIAPGGSALRSEASVFKCSTISRESKAKKSSRGIFSSISGLFTKKSEAMPESYRVKEGMKTLTKRSKRITNNKDYERKEMMRDDYEMERCCYALDDVKEFCMPMEHLEEMKEPKMAPKSKKSLGGDSKSKKMSADINLLIHS